MPSELYFKTNYGRRIRMIAQAATAGLKHLAGSLWSSLELYTVTPPGNLPLTGNGVNSASVTLNFNGQPLRADSTATLTVNIGGGPEVFTVPLDEGTTASEAAAQIVAVVGADADWPVELGIAAVANIISVTPDTGTTLSAFSVAVA